MWTAETRVTTEPYAPYVTITTAIAKITNGFITLRFERVLDESNDLSTFDRDLASVLNALNERARRPLSTDRWGRDA